MKIILTLLIGLICFSAGCAPQTAPAQIRGSANGVVTARPVEANTAKPAERKPPADIRAFDFRNFGFPDPAAADRKIPIRDGRAADGSFDLRKVYYFDVTGDEQEEAVIHLLGAEQCTPVCGSASIFYIYAATAETPRAVFEIATGRHENCGLKAVNFDYERLTLEVFGHCRLDGRRLVPETAPKNPKRAAVTDYTLFEFRNREGLFVFKAAEKFPLADPNIADHTPKISFGSPVP